MTARERALLPAALVTLLLLAAGLTAVRAQELQVIELDFRLAQDLIPILEPLLEPGGVLTGSDDMLFVRTSPENFEQIRAAVATLDRAPKQLMISVGQGTVRDVEASRVEGAVTIGEGDVQVGVNRPPGAGNGAEVTARSRRQEADLHNVSSVRVLEGQETFIAAGLSVPFTESTVQHRPGGVVQQTTTYRDVSTGFYATARVSGRSVILEISSRQQQYRPSRGDVSTQGATTTVTGPLGEWFELGAIDQSASSSTSGLLVWGQRGEVSGYSVWARVDEQ